MKKTTLTLLSALALSTAVHAATPAQARPTIEKSAIEKTEPPKMATINLYAAPESNAKIITQLPVDADLVGIFHQGDWIKVGDRKDGKIGWVNEQQYNQAKQNFYHTHFQNFFNTTYINITKNKDGKTVVEAYQNGKKLSDADAQKLYAKMQAQGKKQWEAMQQFNKAMDKQMQRDYLDARRAMDDAFSAMPGVVIINNEPKK